MKGLTIRKKVTPPASSSGGLATILGFALVVVVALVAVPFLLVAWLIGAITGAFNEPKPIEPRAPATHEVPNTFFSLHYQHVLGEEIPEAAKDYFGDDEPLMLYKAEPEISFFEGYFSNFKIERPGGIFVQKVTFNTELTEIVSMPLYFFNYATREAEEIHDFKDYDLDARGGPNSFKIIASSLEDGGEDLEVEINLTSAIR
jgi:hypothetical protein